LDQMTSSAAEVFTRTYGEEALIAVAYDMKLPPERVNDAAFRLLVESGREISYDDGVGPSSSVAYVTNNDTRIWRRWTEAITRTEEGRKGQPVEVIPYMYDPFRPSGEGDYDGYLNTRNLPASKGVCANYDGELPTDNDEIDQACPRTRFGGQDVVWYGRASGMSVVISDQIFASEEDTLFVGIGDNTFTNIGLLAHEFSHLIYFDNAGIADNTLAYRQFAEADAADNIASWALSQEARSSNSPEEVRPDIIANGLLGNLNDANSSRFDNFLQAVYDARYVPTAYNIDKKDEEAYQEYLESIPWYKPPPDNDSETSSG